MQVSTPPRCWGVNPASVACWWRAPSTSTTQGRRWGRVPLLGLVEDAGDDLVAGGGDRAGQPLRCGDGALAAPPTTTVTIIIAGVEGDGRAEEVVGPAGWGGGGETVPRGASPLRARF